MYATEKYGISFKGGQQTLMPGYFPARIGGEEGKVFRDK